MWYHNKHTRLPHTQMFRELYFGSRVTDLVHRSLCYLLWQPFSFARGVNCMAKPVLPALKTLFIDYYIHRVPLKSPLPALTIFFPGSLNLSHSTLPLVHFRLAGTTPMICSHASSLGVTLRGHHLPAAYCYMPSHENYHAPRWPRKQSIYGVRYLLVAQRSGVEI